MDNDTDKSNDSAQLNDEDNVVSQSQNDGCNNYVEGMEDIGFPFIEDPADPLSGQYNDKPLTPKAYTGKKVAFEDDFDFEMEYMAYETLTTQTPPKSPNANNNDGIINSITNTGKASSFIYMDEESRCQFETNYSSMESKPFMLNNTESPVFQIFGRTVESSYAADINTDNVDILPTSSRAQTVPVTKDENAASIVAMELSPKTNESVINMDVEAPKGRKRARSIDMDTATINFDDDDIPSTSSGLRREGPICKRRISFGFNSKSYDTYDLYSKPRDSDTANIVSAGRELRKWHSEPSEMPDVHDKDCEMTSQGWQRYHLREYNSTTNVNDDQNQNKKKKY